MRKRVLFFSIVCLMFVTLNYTYSAFKNTIVGTISGNAKDWVFKVNVDSGTVYNDSYKVHLTGTSGSFNVRISTVGGAKNAEYSIELTSNDLVKYYTDSACTNLIENNIYKGNISSNASSNVTIYYKASSSINDDAYVKVKGNVMETAMMKNGNGVTEFWNNTYKPYIRTVEFGNDLSNLPSSCTEENLCWDISYDTSQKKKVYGYLIDSGLKDSTDSTKSLYNLYIVSEAKIFAPSDCSSIFSFSKRESSKYISNLIQINFNNNLDTSKITDMKYMFNMDVNLESLDLSGFNTSKVTDMHGMFKGCSSLTSLDLSGFNTSSVTDMKWMFSDCSSLTSLDLSNFNTSNVTGMDGMFDGCSSLLSLNLSNFNTSNVTSFGAMFRNCSSLINLNLSNFNTSKVTYMGSMFEDCSSLTNLDLSSFNTLKVTNMYDMFINCSSLTSLDLSSFNTSKVISMYGMFRNCSSLINLNLSDFNTSSVTNMGWMFYKCSKLTTTINIMNANIADYSYMFFRAATDSNAKITVNYIENASTLVDSMIAGYNNVVKGSIIPEYSITISGNTDITYECDNRAKGTPIKLISTSGNNFVTSFKMNGTTISGNEFTMPGSNITITDIVTVPCKTIETAHNPYPDSQSNVVLGEFTFENAKSLTIILDYQTQTFNDYFYIYDSSTATSGINNNKKYGESARTTEIITINSNYIKITFTSDSSDNNYYGLRATIIPNY